MVAPFTAVATYVSGLYSTFYHKKVRLHRPLPGRGAIHDQEPRLVLSFNKRLHCSGHYRVVVPFMFISVIFSRPLSVSERWRHSKLITTLFL